MGPGRRRAARGRCASRRRGSHRAGVFGAWAAENNGRRVDPFRLVHLFVLERRGDLDLLLLFEAVDLLRSYFESVT